MHSTLPEIIVTEHDYERLTDMLATLPDTHEVGQALALELDRASVIAAHQVPSDVVTMNSRICVEDVQTAEQRDLTLVYPHQADFSKGKLSILAPVGAALLGLRTGQSIEWPVPGGRTKTMRVVTVHWQPEAAKEFDL